MAIGTPGRTTHRASVTAPRRANARPRELRTLAAQLYVLLAAVGAAVLTFVAYSTPYFPIDLTLGRAIQSVRMTWLDGLTATLTWLGFFPQVDIMVLVVVVALFLSRRRIEGIMTAFAAGGAALVFLVVAPLVNRARPTADLLSVTDVIRVGGFPSGHVLTMTAFYGFLIYLAFTEVRSGWWRAAISLLSVVVIVGTGFGRIYVGAHWPSDVVAGYLFGTLWLAVTVAVYRFWRGRTAGRDHVARRMWPAERSCEVRQPVRNGCAVQTLARVRKGACPVGLCPICVAREAHILVKYVRTVLSSSILLRPKSARESLARAGDVCVVGRQVL